MIKRIAYELQQTGKPDTSVELSLDTQSKINIDTENIVISDGRLFFKSLEQRNISAAEYVFENIRHRLKQEPALLFDEALALSKRDGSQSDKASGRLVALASSILDPLLIACSYIQDGHRSFDVLHLLEKSFIYFDTIDIHSLIRLCKIEYETTKNDILSGRIHKSILNYLYRFPNISKELYDCIVKQTEESTANLLCDAILGIAHTAPSEAIQCAQDNIKSGSVIRARVGVFVLGKLLLDENITKKESSAIESTIIELIESSECDIRTQAIHAATNTMHKISIFKDIIKKTARKQDINALSGIARQLFIERTKTIDDNDFKEYLDILLLVNPEYKGILEDIDDGLLELISDTSYLRKVINFFTQWTRKHGKKIPADRTFIEAFEGSVLELVKTQTSFSALITNWMLSSDPELPANLGGVLNKLAESQFVDVTFEKSQLELLDAEGFIFLSRRVLGFVFNIYQQISLTLSFLQIENDVERISPLVKELLINELGYDYPQQVCECCKEAAAATPPAVSNFLLSIVTSIESIQRSYQDLKPLDDLIPPIRLRRQIVSARVKQMGKIFQEVNKKSIVRQIVTEILIKAGRGTFQYYNDSFSEPIHLTHFSQELNIPQREISDPIGNSIRMLQYRLAKRETK